VDQIGPFTQVATSVGHTIALRPDGQVRGWGVDNFGEGRDRFGVNYTQITAGITTTARSSKTPGPSAGRRLVWPVVTSGGRLSAGERGPPAHVWAQVDGTLACWGYNFYNQVDDVPGGAFVQVASGHGHACAITTDDRVLCWGRNDHKQAIPPNVGDPGVTYTWDGFYPPVESDPTLNVVKAGAAVPLKFSLGGDYGLDVLDVDSPASRPLDCALLDPSGELVPTQSAGGRA